MIKILKGRRSLQKIAARRSTTSFTKMAKTAKKSRPSYFASLPLKSLLPLTPPTPSAYRKPGGSLPTVLLKKRKEASSTTHRLIKIDDFSHCLPPLGKLTYSQPHPCKNNLLKHTHLRAWNTALL